MAEEPHQRRRCRPAHLRVPVREQADEGRGARPYRRACHGVVALGAVPVFELTVVEGVPTADADEQLHDAAPVVEVRIPDEFEQERDARERRVVDIALVVHGSVHPVERSLTLLRARGGQSGWDVLRRFRRHVSSRPSRPRPSP